MSELDNSVTPNDENLQQSNSNNEAIPDAIPAYIPPRRVKP